MKIGLLLLPIASALSLLPTSVNAESYTLRNEPFLIARQVLRNTCENETRSYYDPFSRRVVTRTELVCRPRPVDANSTQVCRQTVIIQPNPTTGQMGSYPGQDCYSRPPGSSRPPSSSRPPQSSPSRDDAACRQAANDLRSRAIPSSVRQIFINAYIQACR